MGNIEWTDLPCESYLAIDLNDPSADGGDDKEISIMHQPYLEKGEMMKFTGDIGREALEVVLLHRAIREAALELASRDPYPFTTLQSDDELIAATRVRASEYADLKSFLSQELLLRESAARAKQVQPGEETIEEGTELLLLPISIPSSSASGDRVTYFKPAQSTIKSVCREIGFLSSCLEDPEARAKFSAAFQERYGQRAANAVTEQKLLADHVDALYQMTDGTLAYLDSPQSAATDLEEAWSTVPEESQVPGLLGLLEEDYARGDDNLNPLKRSGSPLESMRTVATTFRHSHRAAREAQLGQ
ncbi:hypothetical protein NCC49_004193 [Naganishia albida]|nr:hypothetical protein NCC49_004193 [Naganishia albida]